MSNFYDSFGKSTEPFGRSTRIETSMKEPTFALFQSNKKSMRSLAEGSLFLRAKDALCVVTFLQRKTTRTSCYSSRT